MLTAFMAPFVAQKIKAGVSSVPWGVVSIPKRARLALGNSSNSKEKLGYRGDVMGARLTKAGEVHEAYISKRKEDP